MQRVSMLLALGAAASLGCGCGPSANHSGAQVNVPPATETPRAAGPCAAWPLPAGCVTRLRAGPGEICAVTSKQEFCWGPRSETGTLPFDPNSGTVRVGPRAVLDDTNRSGCQIVSASSLEVSCRLASALPFSWTGPKDKIGSAEEIQRIATTDESACALLGGRVYCFGGEWGSLQGHHGAPNTSTRAKTVELSSVTDLVAVGRTFCALADTEVSCWGDGRYFPPGALASNTRSFVSVAFPSPDFGCFLASDGAVFCGFRADVQRIDALADATQIVALANDTVCARSTVGAVVCIGTSGAIARRPWLSGATELTEGLPCARFADGSVRCDAWNHGSNVMAATTIEGLGVARAVRGAGERVCAVSEGGELYCWGTIDRDWVEVPAMAGTKIDIWEDRFRPKPARIAGPTDIVDLSPGCVRTSGGKVWSLGVSNGTDVRHMTLAAKTLDGADAERLDPVASCLATRADDSAFSLEADWPFTYGPVAIGPPHFVEPTPITDELGAGFAAPTFTHALHTGFVCALHPKAGIVCRNKSDKAFIGAPWDPLVRSTLPLRVIPAAAH